MRKLFIIITCITIVKSGLAQPIDKNPFTIEKQGIQTTYLLSNWGLSLDVGGVYYNYDKLTNEYIENHWSGGFSLSVFRKNFSLDCYFNPATVNVIQPLDFGYQILEENANLNVIRTGVLGGYTINLPHYFGVQPQIGLLRTQFLVINEEELGLHYTFERTTGAIGSISLNKYFKMRPVGEFLVLHLSGAIAYSNYEKMYHLLGNSYTFFEIGVGYHGWFRKKKEVKIIDNNI